MSSYESILDHKLSDLVVGHHNSIDNDDRYVNSMKYTEYMGSRVLSKIAESVENEEAFIRKHFSGRQCNQRLRELYENEQAYQRGLLDTYFRR
jgi:hypothetical protein